MKKFLSATAVAALSLSATQALAAPMSPAARPMSQHFSPIVQDAFTLLGDTDNLNLVYYVPRRGGIAVQSPTTTNPVPRFQITSFIPVFGFFAGMELANLGGSFSTTSDLGALNRLSTEAAAKGFQIAPAPANRSTTQFVLSGYAPVNGRVEIDCEMEIIVVNGRDVPVPNCFTHLDPTQPYDINTNVMYKFNTLPALGGSVVAQDISFQATTLPGWTNQLRALMATGAQWDNIMTAQIDWDIKTHNVTRQARFTVNWRSLFEQASAFAAFHLSSCVDIEVRAFFERLVTCSSENACGIRIEYLNNGVWGPTAPNDSNFINVVNAVQARLQDELFNEVRRYTTPVNGQVSNQTNSIFTMRANYEKLILERNEVTYIQYNPGPTDFTVKTNMNVTCLLDGFELGRVRWNMEDAGCRALIGQ
ncbi:hypothetical protein HUA74_30045 [Myxococcus sp. CA051A]|uniref:Lipoprotein n=1 Tax=Myxococcus llanfairpwllgwyngyllgogerychwyrndrobwllllantysiliogogogochensis TaxID=2590453 RepID=A0A540WK34_9BACT|nr:MULTISPECIES: hypothetical protein [Myxococcus]NTX04432.1 hypothetical protein [Myxococcus sp. CA040A]NTX12952.1 hypothetical protein [Myxococcus sp. CA056]NTX36598.1 hypothetical protein [Myxococcus sp. CA033]NTX57542.1 hypothetical protein [Myxococcus sp. CA039A]NTX64904.1 hypothetical protein [Myxococcus sp. CA051A]